MRTAEDILIDMGVPPAWVMPCTINAINDARKEAIEECAERVTLLAYLKDNDDKPIHAVNVGVEVSDMETNDYYSVDKQSILSLINELK